ncbi:MAG: glucan biosynthesis protein D [Proteobacteria bacterium]|nr:glucan biosynthesis protein D [Pseudomonadota bacterium]
MSDGPASRSRRDLLAALVATPLATHALAGRAQTGARGALSSGAPFDYAWLKGEARKLAAQPYAAPDTHVPAALAGLDYDHFQAIHFRPEHALWADRDSPFRITFFHRGYTYRERVDLYEVVAGRARPIDYNPASFDLAKANVDGHALPHDLGFAGFRLLFHTDYSRDFAAFLGASYFRAVGMDYMQFGLSARGLAVDLGSDRGEEFPRFTAFWFERPQPGATTLTLYALMDSKSVTGAYRFDLAPGATLVSDVDAALYPRRAAERWGVAPLTSMFLVGSADRRVSGDWRPQIHDSEGLSMHTGAGGWLWRPLSNPEGVHLYTFADRNPRGFGLMQRDRDFDHYQDDGVFYERRPSAWVAPKGDWGDGGVQLLELPAPDETYDNIVAAWKPATMPAPGGEALYAYRIYWGARTPGVPPLAAVTATRTGLGGIVGHKRTQFSWRFVVEFAGGSLATLGKDTKVVPRIHASRGIVELVSARPLDAIHGVRAMFDVRPTDDSIEPVELSLVLTIDDVPVSETWVDQWVPPAPAERARLLARG